MRNELQWQQDLVLVQRTLAQDQTAISELATRMKCIAGFLNSMNRNGQQRLGRDRLEDAAQEVASRVWRDRELFTGHSRLETWVYPYAKHVFRETVATQYRSNYRRAEHDSIHSLYSIEPSVADSLDVQTESERVQRALRAMDPELALLIEQHLQLGYSFARIASDSGLNINTVKARYYRGMKALRAALGVAKCPENDPRYEPPHTSPPTTHRP